MFPVPDAGADHDRVEHLRIEVMPNQRLHGRLSAALLHAVPDPLTDALRQTVVGRVQQQGMGHGRNASEEDTEQG
jgi:hypothetical protein